MDIDIEFWLILLSAVTGFAFVIDKVKFEAGRKAGLAAAEARNSELTHAEKDQILHSGGALQMLRSLFPVFLLVLVIRSFLFEPFTIPSSSMEPTLYPGDFVFVNKFYYGLRLPGIKTKVVPLNSPNRGDVIVFRYPKDEKTHYIKRVIGVPGDQVRYDAAKNVYINGERVPVENWSSTQSAARTSEDLSKKVVQGREGTERLPRDGDVYAYKIRVDPTISASTSGFRPPLDIEIPPGKYLVFGDNRDHSSDSRYWGLVDDRLVVGKAQGIWMHWAGSLPSFARNGWI